MASEDKPTALERAIDIQQRLRKAAGPKGYTEIGLAIDLGALVVAALLEIAEAIRELKPAPTNLGEITIRAVEKCNDLRNPLQGNHTCTLVRGHNGCHCHEPTGIGWS